MKHSTFYLWLTMNILFISLTIIAYYFQLLTPVFANDSSYMTWVMVGTFPFLLMHSGAIARTISVDEQNVQLLRDNFTSTENARESLFIRLTTRYALQDFAITTYVVMGLLGTVLGVILAFQNFPTGDISADPAAIQAVIQTLFGGLSVAFYTTLVGAVLSLWLSVNRYLLNAKTAKLYTDILDPVR